ncbi:hypothetical protein GWK47_038024 [Chionoecetes opilio]|uniref:Uncharacterized protein n=1 Tax=Chionoecetes opilio TaxID=41210 RepID=A0A8J4YS64_CHIOP|nr:hypothetical protein GWK47_038024 [Chionoecetes opilio]
MVQAHRPSQRSCRAMGERTSPARNPGASSNTWRVRRGSHQHITPSLTAAARGGSQVCKRLLRGNTGRNGSLDTDAAAWAIMQYLNTPPQGSEASPAQLITGRQLRDAIPVDASLYEVSERWAWLLRERERAMARSVGQCSFPA